MNYKSTQTLAEFVLLQERERPSHLYYYDHWNFHSASLQYCWWPHDALSQIGFCGFHDWSVWRVAGSQAICLVWLLNLYFFASLLNTATKMAAQTGFAQEPRWPRLTRGQIGPWESCDLKFLQGLHWFMYTTYSCPYSGNRLYKHSRTGNWV